MVDAKSASITRKNTIDHESENDQPISGAVDDHSIRETAFYKWELAGCPCCDGVDFWLQAEGELNASVEQRQSD